MTFLDLIFFIMLGYLIWNVFASYVLKQKLSAYVAGIEQARAGVNALEEKVMIVKTEIIQFDQDKELVLLYDRNNSFLGQGPTEDEAIDSIRKEYPTETFVLVDADAKLSEPTQ